MALIPGCMIRTQSASAQIPWHCRPRHTTLFNSELMESQSELHQHPELLERDWQMKNRAQLASCLPGKAEMCAILGPARRGSVGRYMQISQQFAVPLANFCLNRGPSSAQMPWLPEENGMPKLLCCFWTSAANLPLKGLAWASCTLSRKMRACRLSATSLAKLCIKRRTCDHQKPTQRTSASSAYMMGAATPLLRWNTYRNKFY